MPDTERVRALLRPESQADLAAGGYLDTLPEQPPVAADTRSQSLWLKGFGPKVYLGLIQPIMRRIAAPPGPKQIVAGLELATGETVLDVGCGPGVITAGLADAVAPDGLAVGMDTSPPMLREAVDRSHVRTAMAVVRGDAQRLPFRPEAFDAVCATAVVMLLEDTRAALADMLRVLVPGGRLAIVVPCRGNGPAGLLGASVGRVAGGRMFAAEEIPDLLDDLGVDRIRSHSNDLISTTYARKARNDAY